VRYYVYDGHGSVRALTDSSGNVTDTYDYDAFGNEIHSTGASPNNYLFAGEQYDPDLNLYYNRARYLNTNTGRFWSMDTFEGTDQDPLSLHKYLYAEADPVDNSDPCGRCLPSTGDYGDIVQQYIFADFLAKTEELGLTNTSINAILDKTVPSGGLAPDLIDPVTLSEIDTGQIWEIKSVYSTAAAVAKVALYVSVLNTYGRGTGLKWIPGVTYVPPGIIPINAPTVAITSEPFPGVITYCVINRIELVALANAAFTTGLSLDMATATLTTSLAPAY
jgi:RHS repeat-associated protein